MNQGRTADIGGRGVLSTGDCAVHWESQHPSSPPTRCQQHLPNYDNEKCHLALARVPEEDRDGMPSLTKHQCHKPISLWRGSSVLGLKVDFFFKFIFIHLKDGVRGIYKDPSTDLFLRCLQELAFGYTKARSQELPLGLPCGW